MYFSLCNKDIVHLILGTQTVKATVLKDGHQFVVHMLDPKDLEQDEDDNASVSTQVNQSEVQNEQEKSETEAQEKDKGK